MAGSAFITCTTGAVIPVGPVTDDTTDKGRMQAIWSVLEAVNPGAAVVFQVEYEREMIAFAMIALDGQIPNDPMMVDALALVQRMIQEIRTVLPNGYDFYKNPNGELGIWRIRRW